MTRLFEYLWRFGCSFSGLCVLSACAVLAEPLPRQLHAGVIANGTEFTRPGFTLSYGNVTIDGFVASHLTDLTESAFTIAVEQVGDVATIELTLSDGAFHTTAPGSELLDGVVLDLTTSGRLISKVTTKIDGSANGDAAVYLTCQFFEFPLPLGGVNGDPFATLSPYRDTLFGDVLSESAAIAPREGIRANWFLQVDSYGLDSLAELRSMTIELQLMPVPEPGTLTLGGIAGALAAIGAAVSRLFRALVH